MKHVMIAIMVGMLTVVGVGCGEKKPAAAPVSPAVNEKAKADEAAAKVKAEEDAKKKAEADAKAAEEAAKAKAQAETDVKTKLTQYMIENFGGNGDPKYMTSWFANIEDYEIHKSGDKFTIVVKTSFFPKDSNKASAKTISNVVSMWAADNNVGLWTLSVNAMDDAPLASK